MGNNSHFASIIVPSYNHRQYITQCIESIVNQTYKNFELIVIDDGSSDDSRKILDRLQGQYGFTLVLQENIGLPSTLNKGIKEYAKGEYLTFCASDDYWVPDKLEKQVLFMEQNPTIPMCYGKAYVVDEKSNILERATYLKNRNLRGGYIFKDLLLINFHPPVNYLFRKDIYDKVGYYKDDIFTEDFYMNLLISKNYKIGFIDEYLFYYRTINDISKKPATIKTSTSHLECINMYKDSEFYSEAIVKWRLRNFIWYSSYTKYKLYAIKAMIQSTRLMFTRRYLISFIRLIFSWK